MIDNVTAYTLMDKFLVGTFMFIRILGFMMAAPLFRSSAVIPQVKIYLAIIIAVICTSAFWTEQPQMDFHLWNLVLLVLKEMLVGIILGFSANIVFYAARFAGGIVDIEMGYQTALIFDQNNTTPTLIGELKELITLMMFLILDGHHYLFEALFASFRIVPLSTFAITNSSVEILIGMAGTMLVLGVKMAAPVLVALFCTNLALALLARVAPQTNIFILSFQVKVFVGLIILLISGPMVVYLAKNALSGLEEQLYQIVMSLNPGRV